METKTSGYGVKVAGDYKVVGEVRAIISGDGKRSEKLARLAAMDLDGRPGKKFAEEEISAYRNKFGEYKAGHILGKTPRGLDLVYSSKFTNFSRRLRGLYADLHPAYQKYFFEGYGFGFSKKEKSAEYLKRKAEAEVLRKVSDIRKESDRWEAEKIKATKLDEERGEYLRGNFPYRTASGKWAGGNTEIRAYVREGFGKGSARGWSETAWSDNGKWRGTNANYEFIFEPDDAVTVIGGLVTVWKLADSKKLVKPVRWWEQGRGFALNEKKGFLIGGYHSEAATKEAAIRGAKASKRYYADRDEMELTPEFVNKKWGFCFPGIRGFMANNGIEKERVTVKELRDVVVGNRELNVRLYGNHLRRMGIILNGEK